MYSVTIPTKLVGQEFKTEMPKYQIRVIKENENDKISNDTFWKSNQYEGEDAIGQKLDLTSLLDKSTGYLQGKLSGTGDVDYYKFNMWQYRGLNMVDKYNRDVTVTLDHVPVGCEYDLFLYDEKGNQVGIGKDNGNGGVSVTVPNWSVNNRFYTVKVQAKDGSPISEEYYHLSFWTKEAAKDQGAYQQRQEMSSYYRDFRQKLYEGGDATQEKEALQAIREKYDSFYAEQLEKLHQEQAEEYLKANPDVKSDDVEHSLNLLLNKLTAGEELAKAEKSYLNIFANAKELDLASAKCELNTTLKEEIYQQMDKAGIDLSDSDFSIEIGADLSVKINGIEDEAVREKAESVLAGFSDRLMELFLTINPQIQEKTEQEQTLLKAGLEVEQFLQKASGGSVSLTDITVENGKIKRLPSNLDTLINQPGNNQKYIDYRADILAIKNYVRLSGKKVLGDFSARFRFDGNITAI